MNWFKKKAKYKEALDINFVKGSIGGIDIASNGLLGENFSIIDGTFTGFGVNISGTINATAGYIGGNTITEDSIIGEKFSIIDGVLSAEDVNLTGTFQAGTLTEGVLMSATGMAIYNGAYGGVAFKNNGENIITGSYLDINVDAVFVGGSTALANETLSFGSGKFLGIKNGLIVSKSGF